MEKEIVPYNPSLRLKAIDFNEPCFGYYNALGNFNLEIDKVNADCNKLGMYGKYCTAPTFSQSFRFFREKYGMCAHIKPENNEEDVIVWEYVILTISDSEVCFTIRKSNYSLSEEAEIACLEKLIEIIEKQK